jgi:hypothetical protein
MREAILLRERNEVESERWRYLEALEKIANNTGCVDACPCWAKLRRIAEKALKK